MLKWQPLSSLPPSDIPRIRLLRFGPYELDLRAGELRKFGVRVKLRDQPLKVLVLLLENAGEVVLREEIQARLWPSDTVVEFDHGINAAVQRLRDALGESANKPRYIETLARRGYRFIGEVEAVSAAEGRPLVEPAPQPQTLPSDAPPIVAPKQGIINPAFPGNHVRHWAIGAVCFAAAVVVAIGGWQISASRAGTIPYPLHVASVSKLTSYPGDEREPAISPDGAYVAFSWSGPAGENYDIYLVQAGGQPPLRLTQDPAPDSFPAWSPDGREIAFLRRTAESAAIIVMPSLGGPERILCRFPRIGVDLDFTQHPVFSWSPDGKWIVYSGQSIAGGKFRLFALSVETGESRPISTAGAVSGGDSSPSLSGDARWLAFVRYLAPRNGRIFIQALGPGIAPEGEPTEAPSSRLAVHSPNWIENGEGLVFADASRIFQWDRKRGTTLVYAANGQLGGMSLNPKPAGGGWQMVVANDRQDIDIWSIGLDVKTSRATGPAVVFLHSTEWDSHPDFSPDGRMVTFVSSRSGVRELWVCDADGGGLRQLTHLNAPLMGYPKWSPDGTRIAFHARLPEVSEVYVVDIRQGEPRQVTHENPGLALATWSNDGKFLYASTLVGGTAVSYRFPAEGGKSERLWVGDLVKGSLDGKYILYRKSNTPGIFRRPAEDAPKNREELLIRDFWPTHQMGGYAPTAGGIYYVSCDAAGKPGPFRFFDYRSHQSIDVAPAAAGLKSGLTVSPDGRRLLFSASKDAGGDLLSLQLR